MPGNAARFGAANATEPVIHELPPIRHGGDAVAVRLEVRRADDGTWRGRLLFGSAEAETGHSTADIFCAATEADLWEAVRDLREHHFRDLYRSVTDG
jgi:hypothetical protein